MYTLYREKDTVQCIFLWFYVSQPFYPGYYQSITYNKPHQRPKRKVQPTSGDEPHIKDLNIPLLIHPPKNRAKKPCLEKVSMPL